MRWALRFGGTGPDAVNSVALDASGNIYVTGNFSGVANFGNTNLTSGGSTDVFVAKVWPDGAVAWVRRFGEQSQSFGNGLALDAVGNLHWCGYFSGGVNIGSTNIYNPSGEGLFVSRWSRDLPAFSAQSVSQIVMEHTTVTLSHSVTGTGPFTVQWTFNGTNLPGATNAALVLSNLQPGMAGDYSVWVSGPAGSTLSQSATVTLNALVMRPAITVIGSVGRAYRIEFKDSAAESSWTTLTNFALPIIPFHHVDFTAEGHPRRFYRVTAE